MDHYTTWEVRSQAGRMDDPRQGAQHGFRKDDPQQGAPHGFRKDDLRQGALPTLIKSGSIWTEVRASSSALSYLFNIM